MKPSITRRRFLKSSSLVAGAVALPQFVVSRMLGADGQTAPSNKITLGCIGVGGMGTENMKSFLGQPDCRVVAVCDVSESKRQKAKERVDAQYGDQGCTMIADWRELIARKDIDAAMIATPDHWHSLIAVAAAKAGKDMYCEKPMGVSLEDGQAIRDAVRKHKRVFQAGTWQRSARDFRFTCELARNGYFGKLHTVEVATDGTKYTAGYKGPRDPQPAPPVVGGKKLVAAEYESSEEARWGSSKGDSHLSSAIRRKDNNWIGFGCDPGRVLLALPTMGPSVDAALGSLPEVAMMQTADQRHLDHVPTFWRLNRPRDWTVMGEPSVRADFMVILEVGLENLRQLPFIEDDHSIQAFTSNRAH